MKFVQTLGAVAQSTQQVVGTDLLYLGFGLVGTFVLAATAIYGLKVLNNKHHRARQSATYVAAE